MNYQEYSKATSSRKIILAHMGAKKRIKVFDLYLGSVYRVKTDFFVYRVQSGINYLIQATSTSLSAGEFYYNPVDGYLYVRTFGSNDPRLSNIIITFRMFYSNTPVSIPWDLASGEVVYYDARINSIGELKLELDYENTGVAIESPSSITLQNNDGYFDEIFDTLVWEDNEAYFYSWSTDIPLSQARLIYRGFIAEKSYTSQAVKFNLKDQLSRLRQNIDMPLFAELDGKIDPSMIGTPKQVLFGRLDSHKCIGMDKVLDGFLITGTASGNANRNQLPGSASGIATTNTISGFGTNFTTSLSIGSKIIVSSTVFSEEYTVATVVSDTVITIDETIAFSFSNAEIRDKEIRNNLIIGLGSLFKDEASSGDEIKVVVDNIEYSYEIELIQDNTNVFLTDDISVSFAAQQIIISPVINYRKKNRLWNISGHKLREFTCIISDIIDQRNVSLVNVKDLQQGDLVTINGLNLTVVSIAGNKIKLNQSFPYGTAIGDGVLKRPVIAAYLGTKKLLLDRDYTIENTTNYANIRLDNFAEFNIASTKTSESSLVFISGTDTATLSVPGSLDLRTILKSRDFVGPISISITDYLEVLSVTESTVRFRTAQTFSFTGTFRFKNPAFADDDAIVTVDTSGMEYNDKWIRTPSDAVKWICEYAGFTNINTTSFEVAKNDCFFSLSLAFPFTHGDQLPNIRDMIEVINKSCFGSFYVDNDFNFKYSVLNSDKVINGEVVRDDDILNFSVTTKNNIINYLVMKYSPYWDKTTGERLLSIINMENSFVDEMVGRKELLEVECFLYDFEDAKTIAQRWVFVRGLTQTVVRVNAKLNFMTNTLNDVIHLKLSRMFKRYSSNSNDKIGLINSITKNIDNTTIEVNDLGNIFNRVGSIAPDTEPDYFPGTESVVKYGFILDNDTETPDNTSDDVLGGSLIG